MEEGVGEIELLGIMSCKITTDTIVWEIFYDWSDIENIDTLWEGLKGDWESEGWSTDDKNYTMTSSMEKSTAEVPFDKFMGGFKLLSADKKTLVGLFICEDTNEREIWEMILIKAN